MRRAAAWAAYWLVAVPVLTVLAVLDDVCIKYDADVMDEGA